LTAKTIIDTRNMTSGKPWKLILGFAVPLMLGNVFQQLYAFTDTMVIGNALDIKLCLRQIKLGLPMGTLNIVTSVGGLVVQSVVNGFGVLFIAGFTAANKLYALLEIAASSYGYAISTYTGQNYGAKLVSRIRKGVKSANIIGIITAFIMSSIMIFLGKPILGCFLKGDKNTVIATIKIGYQFLTVLAAFFPLLYVLYIVRSALQGMGSTISPLISSIAQLIMRVSCALILTIYIGHRGVFWGEVFAWIGANIILITSYFRFINKIDEGIVISS
jgi:Na+-driven multidrug efflux pump